MESEKHKIYLAVPGKQLCWGTVTGVCNSTRQHEATPYNGGFGFSGAEDFNILWTDARNLMEEGKVTHFAMLHGDIAPDPSQMWLDVLLDEMDARRATLVSVVAPIKDGRGVTSTGIADLNDPWKPFRRFTMHEVFRLPETFNNVDAGYPDRPLLHNTGLWVCDLRKPCFRAVGEDGGLDLYFQFPTRAVRDAEGKWAHRRQSEDWLFSRDLWNRGVRDTWATRRVRLIHEGKAGWGTYNPWGSFTNGDEDTAEKWRPEREALPLHTLQMLEFELGTGCNLAAVHAACPINSPLRYAALDTRAALDDETIVECAVRAYRELGFSGLVGWVYYNEPLLEAARMFRLMRAVRDRAPAARFILWTNGTLIPEACEEYAAFEQIVVSAYTAEGRRGCTRLTAKGVQARVCDNPALDGRLTYVAPSDPTAPCLRPFVELIVDAYGNTHLCCYDWHGRSTLGNVLSADFGDVARRWRECLPKIAGPHMADDAPAACRACGYRWDKYQLHDEGIVAACRRFRAATGAK